MWATKKKIKIKQKNQVGAT